MKWGTIRGWKLRWIRLFDIVYDVWKGHFLQGRVFRDMGWDIWVITVFWLLVVEVRLVGWLFLGGRILLSVSARPHSRASPMAEHTYKPQ